MNIAAKENNNLGHQSQRPGKQTFVLVQNGLKKNLHTNHMNCIAYGICINHYCRTMAKVLPDAQNSITHRRG
jgi:hypothetical protein